MIGKYSVLGIIPARGDSLRIPKKNIKQLAGKPMILYTAEAAKASKYIDRLILISDSQEIADTVKPVGVEWPFPEPDDLAGATQTDYKFFRYTLEELEKREGYKPDIIVQLRPTSPLRTTAQIDEAIELLVAHPEVDSVRTVSEPEQSPYKMYRIGEDGLLEPLLTLDGVPESFNLPQQKLPKAYKHVGYLDVIWYKTIFEQNKMTGKKIFPLIIEDAQSGINTQADWDKYEYLMSKKREEGKQ